MLPAGQLLLYGLQHVMSMYAGVVAVPLIVGTALGLPFADLAYLLTAALLVSGLATLLQTLGIWKIGAKLPLVQGTSFAAVASMLAIGKDAGGGVAGLQYIFGAVLVAGVVGFLLSGVFNRLLHFFPPVVTGSVITVIGISLLPVAIRWAGGGQPTAESFGAPANIGLAALTLAIILLIYRFLPGFFSRIAILAGLVVGALVAAALGKADFSRIGEAQWFAVSTPFHFGPPQFAAAAIISMVIVMLVIMTETTADILAIGEVVDRPADGRTVVAGLRADCLATAVSGGLLNSFSASAFAQNVGLVAITGIKSRFVVAASGVILVVLGLFPKVGAIVAAIPLPVLGGAGLALFATVAASGIRALGPGELRGQQQPDHRRALDRHGRDPHRRAHVLRALPELVPDRVRLRHQLGRGDGRPVEPAVQRGPQRHSSRGRAGRRVADGRGHAGLRRAGRRHRRARHRRRHPGGPTTPVRVQAGALTTR